MCCNSVCCFVVSVFANPLPLVAVYGILFSILSALATVMSFIATLEASESFDGKKINFEVKLKIES